MSNSNPDAVGMSQVQDKRSKPPGILPKNAQAWVLGLLALVMVVVISLSGRNTPKEKPGTTQMTIDPNAARIREYQNRIEEQARILQIEQSRLAHTQEALGVPPSPAARAAIPYSDSAYPRGAGLRYATTDSSPEENSLQIEMKRREYRSLFASNIALTYRKEAIGNPTALPALTSRTLPGAPAYAAAPALPPELMLASSLLGPSPIPAQEEPSRQESAPRPRARADDEEKMIVKDKEEADPQLRAAEGKLYRLFEGTVLEAVLTNRLDGSFSGPVNCMVTTNVYSHNGQHILIPQGSRILGEVRKVETFGQERLAVFFHRLIMPDGYSVSLDKFQGLNQIGETGLVDQVNHHYMQVFGVSLAIGAIAGLSQSNTRAGLDESATDAYRQGVSTSLSQSSLRILDRYLNVLPTFTIREGHRVKVYLSNDLLLPAYERHKVPSDL
jgi:type IV secretion system protein TrbI